MFLLFRAAGAAVILNLFLCGCGSRNESALLEVIEQKYPVEPDATIRINDTHGSISIRGENSSEVRMRATKIAGTQEQLRNLGVSVTALQNDILIKTNFVRPKGKAFLSNGERVDYDLSIPRTSKITRLDVDDGKVLIDSVQSTQVRATVVDGQMELRDCTGDIEVAVENGDLGLYFDKAPEDKPSSVEARVLHGTLTLSIPRTAPVHLTAQTPTGNIASAFAEMVEIKGRPARKIDVALGRAPRSEIHLQVLSGNIIVSDATADTQTKGQTARQ